MKKKIAKIAIIKPLHNLFDYEVPDTFKDITPGARVFVEFGKKIVVGFIVSIEDLFKSKSYNIKPILEIIDKSPILDDETLKLILWVSSYYHSPIGQVFGIATPSYLRQGKILPEKLNISKKQETYLFGKNILLTSEQQKAIKTIKNSINKYECFLLDGITGSGKTEVYKNIQKEIYKKKLQTLIIVPEKNLIPELKEYFNTKNMKIAEYHSTLTPKQKFINWNLIQNCKIDIIIGTRSSVFLKIPKLGLIIIDEEHDVSFKNNTEAKYNARDVAIFRSKNKNIPIILGSATPSSETIFNVNNNKYTRI